MLNPIAFRPGPVTFWTTLVYLALLIPVIVINEVVPPVSGVDQYPGVDLDEAWLDLTTLSSHYHPYGSRNNEEVREFLRGRIVDILNQNGASWSAETLAVPTSNATGLHTSASPTNVTLFDDKLSNDTFLQIPLFQARDAAQSKAGQSAAYFEGTNLIVYIRGSEDEEGNWWKTEGPQPIGRSGKGGTMINAHYDSVGTGFGATDTGMGVATVLQVIKHFSKPENQPRRGIVALLNNGEEDGLHGAIAFGHSPMLPFVHTFLNLEGAGAGGRALLFRSSDQEVTAAYAKTPDPFGTVLASDMFNLGVIKSGTDFSIFDDIFGCRGLDLAFYKPRARYHTNQDSAKYTSKGSLWHMMSASLHTMQGLSGDIGDTFDGPRSDGTRSKVANGNPSDGVWFDMFGKGFALFSLRGMFAWSLTVLIAGPLILLLLTYIIHQLDKYYFFTASVRTYDQPDFEPVILGGWKGLFRFPMALVVSVTLLAGAALLVRKGNPFIIYSSPYTVWAMMLSLFYFAFWVIMRSANFTRPSALHRGYVHIWLFILGWAILVAATVFEDRFHISAVYFFVFFESAVFLSTFITLCELFALPKKLTWGQRVRAHHDARDHYCDLPHADDLISPTPGEAVTPAVREEDEDEPEHHHHGDAASETTPLIGGGDATGENLRTTFATTYRRSISAIVEGARQVQESGEKPFEHEQAWSGHLPSTMWWFQFLLLGPIMIILSAQAGLLLVDATRQTGTDGSNTLVPYGIMAFFTVLILIPMTPFMHRITHHIPLFLLVVFIGTLIFNLSMFPFSANNRYKAFWQQKIDLDTGDVSVHVTGIQKYARLMIDALPSASGKNVTCVKGSKGGDLMDCSYNASDIPPNLTGGRPVGVPPQEGFAALVTFNATRGDGNTASFIIDAVNAKSCALSFRKPVAQLEVVGSSGWNERLGAFPDNGVGLLKLWRRDWNTPWVVNVSWFDEKHTDSDGDGAGDGEDDGEDEGEDGGELKARASGLDGAVICSWSDINTPGTVPAYEEALQFGPTWAAWTKFSEGIVVASRNFTL